MLIRREIPSDIEAIRAVHASAFADPAEPDRAPVEADLVDALRAGTDWIPELSLVAEEGGEVVGQVVCSRATIGAAKALGLGPLGVRQDRQRDGVGSALMHAVLGAADALGEPVVVLLGHADYYRRFGFRRATELEIIPPVADWDAHFQARPLTTYEPTLCGDFVYAPPFQDL